MQTVLDFRSLCRGSPRPGRILGPVALINAQEAVPLRLGSVCGCSGAEESRSHLSKVGR